jgi:hypothetical protein
MNPQRFSILTGSWSIARLGPLQFDPIGVLASLAAPLADARIGIIAISTFDTDYLLVKHAQLRAACSPRRVMSLCDPPLLSCIFGAHIRGISTR